MLKLIKSELLPMTQQRLTRMLADVRALKKLPPPELRAGYGEVEAVRDGLSELLDKMDGKNV